MLLEGRFFWIMTKHIFNNGKMTKPAYTDIAETLKKIAEGHPLAGHNISFDTSASAGSAAGVPPERTNTSGGIFM